MKWHQLSLFSDKDVKRSPLCRMYFHPPRYLIKDLRIEVKYNDVNPGTPTFLGSVDIWNLFRHRNGTNMVKLRHRYFYDPIV